MTKSIAVKRDLSHGPDLRLVGGVYAALHLSVLRFFWKFNGDKAKALWVALSDDLLSKR